ncbi:hypothetical protein AOT83_10830 [Mycobacteroides sp. H001]|uniref:hypothetical protein n=1 Tax=Mycobacteroides TaxID=670516 RepID=UPI0007147335|nr:MULTISPECIES: hypothetical protein [Mycobacteroides]KRQ29927.1 hypothetical protein AOT86_04330 [Mycobacteroides sp. H072]KRQ41384.1 hypothetical protein AOT84_02145 [Mycobacteroides sp. H002]KRQ46010.1 hypothetical protein AOT85_24315 [Mycobacteroides sp. H054]KRQ70313.1 hypothetical protein AOT83_10830 [Mycobacteroides sp. H001]OHU33294.1 hypothetical protein BKG79_22045 [Mycobacteroides chelonae]
MNWSQIVHWISEHAGVVSVAGIFTLFLSAYSAHVLTKARESLKRIRDYDSVTRKTMVDRCIGLLNVAEEVRAWVPVSRKQLAWMVSKGDEDKAIELMHQIDAGFTTRVYKVQHAGELARNSCPPDLAEYPVQLTLDLVNLLSVATDLEADDLASEAAAAVQDSVETVFLLIRALYNQEMYDNLDPRPLRNAIKVGLTESRRRRYRKSLPAKVISEVLRLREARNPKLAERLAGEV